MVTHAGSSGSMQEVAAGQRLLILAIAVNIVAYIVSNSVDWIIGLLIALGGVAIAIIGMVRVTSGLSFSTPRKVLYVIGLFIPVVSIIVLAMASAEATKTLRANGYKVGFFGAKPT